MVVQETFDSPRGTFAYLDWGGDGPTAHIAHATGFCAGLYSPLAKILSSRLRVVGMDYRGHGMTHAPADPQTLKNWDTFADDLDLFFGRLGNPVIAMGHSLGAVTSMMLAAKRPDLVKALILIDPTIMTQSLNMALFLAQKLGLTKIFPIVSGAARRNPIWPDKSTIMKTYSGRAPFNKWSNGFLESYLDHGFEELKDGKVKLRCEPAWESRCFATCPAGAWKIPSLLKIPVLIIYGAESDVFLEKCARKFKVECPWVKLQKIDGVGHFVPMEKPRQTALSIFTFLEEIKIL